MINERSGVSSGPERGDVRTWLIEDLDGMECFRIRRNEDDFATIFHGSVSDDAKVKLDENMNKLVSN